MISELTWRYAKLWSVNMSKGAFGSPSYFAEACSGAPLDVIRKYITQQESPNSKGAIHLGPERPSFSRVRG